MRVLLFTGKGGVGKTTIAAGTAALSAAAGRRTLVLSTDPAHSLADALGIDPHQAVGVPCEVAPRLSALHVDVRDRFANAWAEIQHYLLTVMSSAGMDPIEAEELTVLPGAEEVLALLEVRDQVNSGNWDTVIVDCAPTAETLRLLSLPDALRWYMDRIWPSQRRVMRMLRPLLNRASTVPMPRDNVMAAIERLHEQLSEVRQVLTEHDATVRIVMTPERVVAAEGRRTLTSLTLYGYRVDGVVVNRVFPDTDADPWREHWVAAQAVQLTAITTDCHPLPVWRSGFLAQEPIGVQALAAAAADTYGSDDPLHVYDDRELWRLDDDGEDVVMWIAMPLAEREDLDLGRHGDELVVAVDTHRRVIYLPSSLRQRPVRGARLEAGGLSVRFGPVPSDSPPVQQP